jgi:hypothetical protein
MIGNQPDAEFAHDQANEAAFERLGTREPRCSNCLETATAALISTPDGIYCYECFCKRQGRSPVEDHHPAGQHNMPETVRIPGNDHRVLSEMQRTWPEETLRNPDGSPLLRMAACVRGWIDVLYLIIERVVGWIPRSLERLDALLTERDGSGWWGPLGYEA